MLGTRKLLIAKGARTLCAKNYNKPDTFGLGIIPENGFDEKKRKCHNGIPLTFLVRYYPVDFCRLIMIFWGPKKWQYSPVSREVAPGGRPRLIN